MSVYFATRGSNPSVIKIGTADDIDARLAQLAAGLGDSVELLARCDGGREVEAFLHTLFLESRVEGEWFDRSPALNFIIQTVGIGAADRRVFGRRAATDADALGREDGQIARASLKDLMSSLGAFGDSIGKTQEAAFAVLHNINPLWTRRRVRAIWEGKSRRIDLFEMRDLNRANGLGPEVDAYRELASGLGGSHRAGTEE